MRTFDVIGLLIQKKTLILRVHISVIMATFEPWNDKRTIKKSYFEVYIVHIFTQI